MKTCKTCGSECLDRAKVCDQCGEKMAAKAEEKPERRPWTDEDKEEVRKIVRAEREAEEQD